MNFFQKLTGSLKMPVEQDLIEEKRPPSHDQPQSIQAQTLTHEAANEPEIKSVNFREMFEAKKDANDAENYTKEMGEEQVPDLGPLVESKEGNDHEETLVVAQLAKTKTAQISGKNPLVSTLKKTLPRIHFKKDTGAEELEINAPEGQLAIDVYETQDEIVLKSTIAGVKPDDLDVGIEENTVNIRGARHNEEKVKGEDYFYQECYWGTFSRSVILPVEVDADKTQATLRDGVLTIRLPKIVKEKEKKIKIAL